VSGPWRASADLVRRRVVILFYHSPPQCGGISIEKNYPEKFVLCILRVSRIYNSKSPYCCSRDVSARVASNFKEKGTCSNMILWCDIKIGGDRLSGQCIRHYFVCAKWDQFNNSWFDQLTNKISTHINVSRRFSAHKEMGWGKDNTIAQETLDRGWFALAAMLLSGLHQFIL